MREKITMKIIILILMFFALIAICGELNQLLLAGENIIEGMYFISWKIAVFLTLNFALIKVVVNESIDKLNKEKKNDTEI